MMHYIRGVLIEKNSSKIIVELHNSLGYEIHTSAHTLSELPEVDATILLYTCLFIKEEKQVLYGFSQRDERDFFQELLKINNIGPKVALAILSEFNIQKLIHVIQNKEIIALQQISGIGRKTAERLLLELNNRLDTLIKSSTALAQNSLQHRLIDATKTQQDAVNALVTLGYKQSLAHHMIQNIADRDQLSVAALIRLALQKL